MRGPSWRTIGAPDDEHLLVEGDGFKLKIARYAEPWRLEVLEDLERIASEAKPSSCVVVGAHIGEPVLWLWRGGCGSILAYEPDPSYCRLLHENLELNGVAVEVRCEAVGSSDTRQVISAVGGPVTAEIVGVNRVLRGDVDLVALCCPACVEAASSLGCESLGLPGALVVPKLKGVRDKLMRCGLSVSETPWHIVARK